MSKYTDLLVDAVRQPNGTYKLNTPITWRIGHLDGPEFIVPAGFVFDVSIPWWARWAFDPDAPRYLKPAALHDKMLVDGWSRITAGAEFHNALAADGVSVWRRVVMWLAVSLWKYGQ